MVRLGARPLFNYGFLGSSYLRIFFLGNIAERSTYFEILLDSTKPTYTKRWEKDYIKPGARKLYHEQVKGLTEKDFAKLQGLLSALELDTIRHRQQCTVARGLTYIVELHYPEGYYFLYRCDPEDRTIGEMVRFVVNLQ
ncbi:MAG: hypothetical protein EOP48_08690 [Sphingobacteriales bacterium]|nr:MAG: hypothetical protein EOP48_08690 [Sphingobacteriales bacterium]